MAEDLKKCNKCHIEKHKDDFYAGAVCKPCQSALNAKAKKAKQTVFTSKDGIFGGRCRICAAPKGSYVPYATKSVCTTPCSSAYTALMRAKKHGYKLDITKDDTCDDCNTTLSLDNWSTGFKLCIKCAPNWVTSRQKSGAARRSVAAAYTDTQYKCKFEGCDTWTSRDLEHTYRSFCSFHRHSNINIHQDLSREITCACGETFVAEIKTHYSRCPDCR